MGNITNLNKDMSIDISIDMDDVKETIDCMDTNELKEIAAYIYR